MHFAIDPFTISLRFHSHVDFSPGVGGDHVAARTSTNNSHIRCQPSFRDGKPRDHFDLMCELVDGACALSRLYAGMRSYAGNLQFVNSNTFSRSLERSFKTLPWLEHEHCLRFEC